MLKLVFEHSPVAIVGADRVEAVRFATPSGEQPLACDCVILALGQQPDPPPWLTTLGVATDDTGRIRVDAEGRTSNARVYAGGDASHGPDLVVTALAAGRRAAAAILADHAAPVWQRHATRAAAPPAAEEAVA